MKDFMLEVQFLEGAVAVTRHENGRPVALVDEAYEDHAGDKMAAAELAIERGAQPVRPEWDGEGLPPVGTVCEYNYHPYLNWPECEVIAHFHDGEDPAAAVLMKDSTGSVSVFKGVAKEFRPLRTPEQIRANEERERATAEMLRIFSTGTYDGAPGGIQALYCAGYRKVEGGAS